MVTDRSMVDVWKSVRKILRLHGAGGGLVDQWTQWTIAQSNGVVIGLDDVPSRIVKCSLFVYI